MKIAIVSPWPDDRSGIADYTFSLAKGLRKFPVALTVFTLASDPRQLEGVALVADQPASKWDLSEFDLVVYHVGNNEAFHGHMLSLIQRFPGVVHLHDYSLQHLVAGMAEKSVDWDFYLDAMRRLYGKKASDQALEDMQRQCPIWERDDVINFPLCELFLELCQGAILHSRFVRNKIRERLPRVSAVVIPQVYTDDDDIQRSPESDVFRIGVFGHVQRNRCIDVLLKSLKNVVAQGRKISVRVVGPFPDQAYNDELKKLLLDIEGKVQFDNLGYASREVFLAEMASCDVCVALRNPTIGETSAVVTQAMKLGKPIVVTEVGWYAELPECISKITPGTAGVSQLTAILQRLLDDAEHKRRVGAATLRFAQIEYDFQRNSEKYYESLLAFHRISQSESECDTRGYVIVEGLTQAMHDLQLDTRPDEANLREGIYRKLAFCFEP